MSTSRPLLAASAPPSTLRLQDDGTTLDLSSRGFSLLYLLPLLPLLLYAALGKLPLLGRTSSAVPWGAQWVAPVLAAVGLYALLVLRLNSRWSPRTWPLAACVAAQPRSAPPRHLAQADEDSTLPQPPGLHSQEAEEGGLVSRPKRCPPQLRPAVAAEAEVLADIHLVSRRQAMPWLPELHTREETVAWMRDMVLPGSSVWVAECEGQLAGYAVLAPGELEQLYVHPHFQGRGVGSSLLTHVKALSPQGLGLSVFQRNLRARQFYEAHGFTPAGSSEGSGNEEGVPDIRYEWKSPARQD